MICGLCGRIARNLHNALEFLSFLCWGRPLKYNINGLIIGANFASFTGCVGELRGICIIRWNFAKVQNGIAKFCLKNFVVNLKMDVYG